MSTFNPRGVQVFIGGREIKEVGGYTRDSDFGTDLPDPPDNPEFNEIFTEAEQDKITARFDKGIKFSAMQDQGARNGLVQAGINARKRYHDKEARRLAGRVTLGDALPELGERYRKREHRPRKGGNRRVKEGS